MSKPFDVALVGFGAIGQEVAKQLRGDAHIRITQVVIRPSSQTQAQQALQACAPAARMVTGIELMQGHRPDLVVECAGHAAVDEHVIPALQAGLPCVVASVGALHDATRHARLTTAAQAGRTQVQLIPGAVAAIDALSAAKWGGLDSVTYVGRKPPLSWTGTPAEQRCDLRALTTACVVFEGTAREAAQAFPKNANVAATVSLAGIGLDATRVQLIADPAAQYNTHQVLAHGAFGKLDMTIENFPLAANPKTSALTVFSVVRAIRNAAGAVVI